MVSAPNYGFLDRLLHRLALGYAPIAEVSFDIDQATVRTDPTDIIQGKHVFVAGLARAGSTVLMRKFYATGCFRSLTYRDMPLVLAPNIWRRMSALSRRNMQRAERAHADDLLVDFDSPESFDEVFWRNFAGKEYIAVDRLTPHEPAAQLLTKYVHYVNAILCAANARPLRYLSKNNNNILRLPVLQRAFPRALILIPFRDPLQHASSLLRQHVHFSEMQTQHEFVLDYMTWLGHYEFGLGHRPFSFNASENQNYPANTLNYWLLLWCEVYGWLVRTKPSNALFVCYEDLCGNPDNWRRLAELADIAAAGESGDPLKLSCRPVNDGFDRQLAARAATSYAYLVRQSRRLLP